MSGISDNAQVSILLADYAQVAESGKLNVLGGDLVAIGFDALQGLTTRFTVVASVRVPSRLLPADISFELALQRDGVVVALPGPVEPQNVRIGQPITLDKPPVPNASSSQRDMLLSSHVLVVNFEGGLPLAPGVYEWVARVDGDESHCARLPFLVVGNPSAPVIG